jgi:ABC-type Fe3+/spermidine/putrescine transport system ATPase subunit
VVNPVLEVIDATIGRETDLLRNVNFDIAPGEFVALTGSSGIGKSTLLLSLVGAVALRGGEVLVHQQPQNSLPIHERSIGLMFQQPFLFQHLSVLDNVAYGLRRAGASRDLARQESQELLEWLGLSGYEQKSVEQLSGGQAQRVALARSLARNPTVMLLDEPFSALDEELRHRLQSDIREKLAERNCATLYVTHNLEEARNACDRTIAVEQWLI